MLIRTEMRFPKPINLICYDKTYSYSNRYILFQIQTNYDASEKQKSFVPVNYRDFIDYLEHKTKLKTVDYIPTEADFKEDRGRN